MLTIRQHKKTFDKLSVAIVGDIRHSRVARSGIQAMKTLGTTDIRLIAPETLHYKEETPGLERFDNLKKGIEGADVIISLRMQKERMVAADIPDEQTYFENFGLTNEALKCAKPDVILMHPGPVNHGIELESSLVDGSHSVILQQVTNGIAVRMAVMEILAGAF
jgi:aspartate carbamoyltransferase catalytic subunit